MSRILLADDSPHAQRMGERILLEEGYEVVTVTDGETALMRLTDVDPDLILADVLLPQKSGYEICRLVKSDPRHHHARVVLLAGLLEPVDEEEVRRVSADAVLRKPFEASVVIETVKPLIEAARSERSGPEAGARGAVRAEPEPRPLEAEAPLRAAVAEAAEEAPPAPVELDAERVRAAVTLALDAALPTMVEEITQRVLIALRPVGGS